MQKPCQNCQKNPATVHLTEIQDNRMTELHLCQACAQEKGLASVPASPKFSIGELLANMVDGMSTTEEERVGPVQCPSCGMHYSTFRTTGRLGCAECYAAFGAKLKPLLRRIHGSTRHVGKLPAHDGAVLTPQRQVQRLHDELQRAVEREEFELAAEIRDRIKTLEREASA
ncbi:MAG: UvrB/UvrC motif-containing protein [Candidatus Eisenbacteria bacterium]